MSASPYTGCCGFGARLAVLHGMRPNPSTSSGIIKTAHLGYWELTSLFRRGPDLVTAQNTVCCGCWLIVNGVISTPLGVCHKSFSWGTGPMGCDDNVRNVTGCNAYKFSQPTAASEVGVLCWFRRLGCRSIDRCHRLSGVFGGYGGISSGGDRMGVHVCCQSGWD